MRKQTICFVEPSDIIYLIDDNFEIKQLELYPTHLDASLDDRAFISDVRNISVVDEDDYIFESIEMHTYLLDEMVDQIKAIKSEKLRS